MEMKSVSRFAKFSGVVLIVVVVALSAFSQTSVRAGVPAQATTAATAAITTATMQAIIKLRIPVALSRIITQGTILELRRSSLPIIDADRTPPMRLILTFLISCDILIGSALCRAPAEAQLRGHGGPIRALAISTDGATVFMERSLLG